MFNERYMLVWSARVFDEFFQREQRQGTPDERKLSVRRSYISRQLVLILLFFAEHLLILDTGSDSSDISLRYTTM